LETLSEEEQNKYILTKAVSDFSKNNSIETFFVERAAQLLKTGGVAAIILPVSVLDKGGIYTKCREIILQYFDIVAVANFGDRTFGQTNTATVTLFLRRKNTETEISKHLQNRVDEWFKGNFDDDKFYGDEASIRRYTEYVGIDYDLYKQLMQSNLSDELRKHSIIQSYENALDAYSKRGRFDTKDLNEQAKAIRANIRKRVTDKSFKKLLPDTKQQEVDRALLDFCRAIEKEKLYYFLLAESNPQAVLVITSPTDKDKQKKFLGYEWTNRKGNEGIKYLNVKSNSSTVEGEDADDDMLQQIKGISGIQTPLFNPADLDDESKLNTLIRDNFINDNISIQKDLSDIAKSNSLIDMIDFSRPTFNKAIKTSVDERIVIKSKYPLVRLEQLLLPVVGAQTKIAKEDILEKGKYPVITQEANRIIAGYTNNSKPITDVPLIVFGDHSCTYKYVDYPFVRGADGTQLIKVNEDVILKYLYDYLQIAKIENQGKYQRHFKHLKQAQVPIPSKDIQQQIVDECQKVDEEYNTSRMSIEDYREKIAQVFENLQVIIRIGGGVNS
jgi:type I restriction-modification system DNA methylase subunit